MSYLTQKTIKKNISFSGIALHSGLNVNVCIKPAEPDFGIVFKRVDLKLNNIIFQILIMLRIHRLTQLLKMSLVQKFQRLSI